jgi:hypothetical protein
MALISMKGRVAAQFLVPLITAYMALIVWLSHDEMPTLQAASQRALPAAGLFILCQLLQDLIPKSIKEVLVFWRLTDRLPGHRAYSHLARTDTRIPVVSVNAEGGEAELDGPGQNALWYGKYKTVSSDPSVAHESFRYLAWRDVTTTLVLLCIVSLSFAPLGWLGWRHVIIAAAGCLGTSLVTALAARNAANSLVRNVLAQTTGGE